MMSSHHRVLLRPGMPFPQPRENVPKSNGYSSDRHAAGGACRVPENATGGDENIKAEGEGEGKKREIGNNRYQAMEMLVILAAHEDAMIGAGRNQQPDHTDHEPEREPVQ
jgi:hypothetical protein